MTGRVELGALEVDHDGFRCGAGQDGDQVLGPVLAAGLVAFGVALGVAGGPIWLGILTVVAAALLAISLQARITTHHLQVRRGELVWTLQQPFGVQVRSTSIEALSSVVVAPGTGEVGSHSMLVIYRRVGEAWRIPIHNQGLAYRLKALLDAAIEPPPELRMDLNNEVPDVMRALQSSVRE